MEENDLTRLGFRKGLGKEHRDYELVMRLEDALIRHAKGWGRFSTDIPNLLRQSIDEVIDAPRSRRFLLREPEKTEKAYIGTKIEILLRNHLDLERGETLDVRVDGIEVDIKNTIKVAWMIPREAIGHPCILISANEKRAKCSFGLVVIREELFSVDENECKPRILIAQGADSVHWLLKDKEYPRSFWTQLNGKDIDIIMNCASDTERLSLILRMFQRIPVAEHVLFSLV